MRRFQASLLLGLLLALSLSLKAMGGFKFEQITARQDASAFVQSIGFWQTGKPNEAWTQARNAGCTIEVMQVSQQGWERSAVDEYAGGRRHGYFYAGQFHAEHPTIRATVDFYLARLKGYLHLPFTADPVWAVVEDPQCPASVFATDVAAPA